MIAPGAIIDGRYEVVSTLGIGGFGSVYRARQTQFGREVALKILTISLLEQPDGVARFEREAKSINALKHKNIVGLYGYGIWNEAPYMVMELVLGTSVEALLRTQKQIEPARALRLIKQVFEGLACAHATGIVHRDLKPSNIMVTEDADEKECVRLIDFGLAKLMPTQGVSMQRLTETGIAVGTCNYMAPEQALGGAIDPRTDIYATGCILYQMLSGDLPFNGSDPIEVMHQQLNQAPAPFADRLPDSIPSDVLYSLVLNYMAKDPADRYQNCAEAISDIEHLLEGRYSKLRTTGRNSASAATVDSKRISRHQKRACAIAAAICVGLVSTAVVINANIQEQRRLAQIEMDKEAVQEQIRLRLNAESKTNLDAKSDFARIKAEDDRDHFLSPAQRQFVLVTVGLQQVNVLGGRTYARQLADEATALIPQAISDGSRMATDVVDIYAKLGDEERAFETLKLCESSRDIATRFDARQRLTQYYLSHRDFEAAKAAATANLQEKSRFTSVSHAVMDLGRIAYAQHDYAKSIEYYEEVARQKDAPRAYLGVARALLAQGKLKLCMDWCNMAIERYQQLAKDNYSEALELKAEAMRLLAADQGQKR